MEFTVYEETEVGNGGVGESGNGPEREGRAD